MFILDQPYVSPLLEDTLAESRIPVLVNSENLALKHRGQLNCIPRHEFAKRRSEFLREGICTNSENALQFLLDVLGDRTPASQIRKIKDKVLFRETLAPLYPEFYYSSLSLAQALELGPETLQFPLVLKPAVGFFSVGVAAVPAAEQWYGAVKKVGDELAAQAGLYPESVLGPSRLLVEQYLEGEELAVDAYYTDGGLPVILNIMAHPFQGPEDTDDRIYYTSADVIRRFRAPLQEALSEAGRVLGLKNFPVHAEFRLNRAGKAVPVEMNPLRFAGFGATDLAWFAWGINTHQCFFDKTAPDWDAMLRDADESIYSLVVCHLPRTLNRTSVCEVRWEELQSRFEHLLEFRPMDYRRFPLLGFAFIKSPGMDEPEALLHEDFTRYLVLAS
ncbi:MAG: ATP-grasp domain-containing protein [Acidobacteriota bacterium]